VLYIRCTTGEVLTVTGVPDDGYASIEHEDDGQPEGDDISLWPGSASKYPDL
jgi:hypothetical protein